jgi:hypothetical protein
VAISEVFEDIDETKREEVVRIVELLLEYKCDANISTALYHGSVLSVCLSVHLSISIFNLSIYLSISVSVSFCLSFYLSISTTNPKTLQGIEMVCITSFKRIVLKFFFFRRYHCKSLQFLAIIHW